ncbi:MAG: NYN domain-containing protein [Burkholderiales bacterium]|nr:NYN domain-containing protein [Burkholderiales bacterium]
MTRTNSYLTGEEKGIDVRLAIDIISMAWQNLFDVALVFSQDQDLSEAAREVRDIARRQSRWIKIASAFPSSPVVRKPRGINWTDWIRIDRAMYDTCIDPRDYRPKAAAR